MKENQVDTLEGFIQVSTKVGAFYCRKVKVTESFVILYGPSIITMQMVEDPKSKRAVPMRNTDKAEVRYINVGVVVTIDVLDPVSLDRNSKELYQALSGVELM